MKTHLLIAAMALVAAGGWSGCATSRRPVYDPSQTGTAMSVEKAEVIAVRDVDIKPSVRPAGGTGAVGTVTGGAVTSVITGSTGAIGRAVGSVVGGAVGSQADAVAGEEITLNVEGRTIIVVQERSNPPLAEGEKVLILRPTSPSPIIYGGGRAGSPYPTGGGVRVVREDRYSAAPLSTRGLLRGTPVAQLADSP